MIELLKYLCTQGLRFLRQALPDILANRADVREWLTDPLDLHHPDERIGVTGDPIR
jgi:hypothetical protein